MPVSAPAHYANARVYARARNNYVRTHGKADKSEGASKPKKHPRGNEKDGGIKCKVMQLPDPAAASLVLNKSLN